MGVRKCSECGKSGHNSRTCRIRVLGITHKSMKLFGVELEVISVPWSEEEHKLFLVGLQQLGKGDWRGISRNFVTSRTSTQVASHAQKFFLRQNNHSNNTYNPTTLISMEVVRKEAQVQEDNESSITVGIFPKLVASTAEYYCTRTNRQPIAPVPEIPDCRLFNNPATQNAPSLELSLASPLQPPVSRCARYRSSL
ncbi:UNVERIFIED_CONTAM: Transcription factor R1 [Sesamum calycinum]|uniref:Transcription factor R1 n=1 Tax=Sesamum calycinum TaxID=2727403 RepID=A0AAW2QWS5_9LAMI